MVIICVILMVVGLVLAVQPIEHTLMLRRYTKSPDMDRSQRFEELDVIFRKKALKWIFLAVGIVCIVCSLIIYFGHSASAF